MREPWFWREQGLAASAVAFALSPAAMLYDLGQRARAAMARPEKTRAPVICVGNVAVGGTGKTPFALMLHGLLKERGVHAHFQSRGHGGAQVGPLRVDALHTAYDVGDEPLLLSAAGPTWVAKNRRAGVHAASDAGADAIIMDDGFQNPTVAKAVSILLVSDADRTGKARPFPAGPLREPLARAVARADIVIATGDDAAPGETGGKPLFRASTDISLPIAPQPVVAFCGIGRPERFFAALEAKGYSLAARVAFPDHHAFRPGDLAELRAGARKAGAALVTTQKDFVRLSDEEKSGVAVARLSMSVDRPHDLVQRILSATGLGQ